MKYGKIVDGELVFVGETEPGAKPIQYAAIPEFDQFAQAVYQDDFTEYEDHIFVDVEIVEIDEE